MLFQNIMRSRFDSLSSDPIGLFTVSLTRIVASRWCVFGTPPEGSPRCNSLAVCILRRIVENEILGLGARQEGFEGIQERGVLQLGGLGQAGEYAEVLRADIAAGAEADFPFAGSFSIFHHSHHATARAVSIVPLTVFSDRFEEPFGGA